MKRIRIALLVLLIAFALASVALILYDAACSARLRSRFSPKADAYPYAQAVQRNELDLDAVAACFPDDRALLLQNYRNKIEAPAAISYYADVKGEPVWTIEKGERIDFRTEDAAGQVFSFRGIETLPTDKAGWRLAKPFAAADGETADTLLYVKLEDLAPVAARWLEENPGAEKALQGLVRAQGLLPTKGNLCRYILLFTDRTLYSQGVFLSADLQRPVLSPASVLCLFVTVLLLAGYLIAKRRTRQ